MKAMILDSPGRPLRLAEIPIPAPKEGELLLKVHACGMCRTDLHVIDGELDHPILPLIPGHEIIGTVVEAGAHAGRFPVGQRIGVPWLGGTCGHCRYCRSGRENLCSDAKFTGYTLNGGYAEYTVANENYCFPIPDDYPDAAAAPLLCAGLIGYRALRAAGDAERIGIYGFGAAAHIIAQVARWQGRKIYAFARPGDCDARKFAMELGAAWAGDSGESPPDALDAAIIFAPVGSLVPEALRNVSKGGIVVCAGIHMSDIPGFPYSILWGERRLCSIANLTRGDGEEFFGIAHQSGVRTEIETFPLVDANEALKRLKEGRIRGAAVLLT